MAQLTFQIEIIDPRVLAPHGDFTLPARLYAGERGPALLDRAATLRGSESPRLDREAAADEIARQNPQLAPPNAETLYIVAGQQVGLLTGPLYTFLKAVTAIALARDLRVRTGCDVRSLFWMASEDHDILEVNRVLLGGEKFVHEYRGERTRGKMPQVADVPAHAAREGLIDFVTGALPPTDFTSWVCDWIRAADFRTYATAFRDLMDALFHAWDLRFADPLALRHLTAPVLADLVERWEEVDGALARGGEILAAHGFTAPLAQAGFFEIAEGCRRAVDHEDGKLRLARGLCTFAEAAAEIRAHPERFSPGAALRPICQDAVLPVAATVAGPSELLYLWQIEPLADLIGLAPSLRAPRISATFLEPKVLRAAEKLGLLPARIFEASRPDEGAKQADPQAQAIAARSAELIAAIDELGRREPPRWLRTGRGAIEAGTTKILGGLHKERLEAQGRGARQIDKVTRRILPGGKPQERAENIAWFLNLYGPEFVRSAIEELDPWSRGHAVVSLVEKEPVNGD